MDEIHFDSEEERERRLQANRQWIEIAKRSKTKVLTTTSVIEKGESRELNAIRKGAGPIAITIPDPDDPEESKELDFLVYDFQIDDKWGKYLVVVRAAFDAQLRPRFDKTKPIKLRIDSGCVTGQVFHDNTCECREQMHAALERIAAHGQGVLISIPEQDGRGRKMPFKLATLILQKELGLDTVGASALLDPVGEKDERTYGGAIAILRALGIEAGTDLEHLSNNEEKHAVLRENGYNVSTEPLNVGHTAKIRRHLESKQKYLGQKDLDPEREEGSDDGPESEPDA